jgi:CheY-like chemotaxis protein
MIPQQTKILCVDDDIISLKLLRHVLSPWGCEIFEAKSGQEALEVIARENVDLVLLDVVMPGMDGYEVCKTIKGSKRTRGIPVVMITGLISKEDRIKGIEAGAEEFLTKPFDAAEVRARIKMLLKTKNLNERRTGEILIELGLINDQQLQEALKISKEKNVKVGEALYSMGALSRDTIYWGLSNQLQMTYIELSPEMVDKDLIQEFSLDVLKRWQCLPLYETNAEIHFAIADPTDQKSVEAIESLKPGKAVQLHLGLPEKIADILSYYERERPDGAVLSRAASDSGKSWDDLVAALLSMPSDAVYWLSKTRRECRLLAKKGSTFEVAGEYPVEVYALFQNRTRSNLSSRFRRGETVTVLSDRSQDKPAAFKIWPVDAVEGGFVRIERIPVFSKGAFERSHPLAPSLIAETKRAFEERRRLVVGGADKIFIKQICYSLLMEYFRVADFPPVVFLESQADIYLPEASQLSSFQWDLGIFLESLGEEVAPFVFYEPGSREAESVEACLSGFLASRLNNVILCLPSTSAEAMREALAGYLDQPQKGFRAVFIEASLLKPIC